MSKIFRSRDLIYLLAIFMCLFSIGIQAEDSQTVSEEKLNYLVAKGDWDSLVEIGKPAVQALIDSLNDESKTVRKDAASALSKIGDVRAISQLVTVMKDFRSKEEVKVIANALLKLEYQPSSAEDRALLWLATSGFDWRHHVAEASYFDKDFDKDHYQPLDTFLQSNPNCANHFCKLLRKFKARSQWDEAVYVAYLLGRIGDTNAVDTLIVIADGKDRKSSGYYNVADRCPLTAASVHALGRLRDRKAVEPIIQLIQKPSTNDILENCAFALGEIRDERAVQTLGEMLHKNHRFLEYDTDYRPATIAALGKLGTSSTEWLLRLLKSSDTAFGETGKGGGHQLSQLAIDALGNIGDRRAIQPLCDKLTDKETMVRVSAVQALAKIKDPKSVECLIGALKDTSDYVRKHVVKALESQGWKP